MASVISAQHSYPYSSLGTSDLPMIVKLFACSQPEVFEAMALGQVLVCARMLLKVWTQSSRERRYCYLTTTHNSQISILQHADDLENKPFKTNGVVNNVMEWKVSSAAKNLMEKSCIGGFYMFPPLPVSLKQYQDSFPPDHPMDVVSAQNLVEIIDGLQYQQHVRVNVQGRVVALEFIPLPTDEEFEIDSIEGWSHKPTTETTDSSTSTSASSQTNSHINSTGRSDRLLHIIEGWGGAGGGGRGRGFELQPY